VLWTAASTTFSAQRCVTRRRRLVRARRNCVARANAAVALAPLTGVIWRLRKVESFLVPALMLYVGQRMEP
jgi:hypothetical protein